MKKERKHNRFTYRMEMTVIRVRDLIRPPAKVLLGLGVQTGMTVPDFGCGPRDPGEHPSCAQARRGPLCERSSSPGGPPAGEGHRQRPLPTCRTQSMGVPV